MSAIALTSRAIIGAFYNRLQQNIGANWINSVAMTFQSNQLSEEYKWLGMAPVMRQWIGGRNAKGFRENGIEIKNLDFEATMEVLLDELRYDKSGQVLVRIQELADRTNAHWAKLLSTLMINGESYTCYDGEYFFDVDHSEGDSGSQSNDLSIDISALGCSAHGSTTAPSPEEAELCILQAISAILGFKDDVGEPMNEGANDYIVMGPPSLMGPILAATTNPVITSGKTNTIVSADFRIRPVVNARLSSWTSKFAIYRADGLTKPFICQEAEPVNIDAVAEGSELEFNEKKHRYGVSTKRNVGYGYWQHACLVTMT